MSDSPRRRNLPLLLSALAYPGAGQFLQKRLVWGLVYAIAFTLFVLLSLKFLLPPLWHTGTAFLAGETPEPVAWKPLMKPLVLAVGVYAANLYDVWWHDFRAARTAPR